MKSVGDRVGAIVSMDSKEVMLLGYGVYQGALVPGEDAQGMAKILREAGIPNPTILLDSGAKVYGCECWWGDEGDMKADIAARVAKGAVVTEIDIVAYRQAQEEAAQADADA